MRPSQRPAWRLRLAKVALLCALAIPAPQLIAQDKLPEHDIGMFEHMCTIPDIVDAAAIFNNPAEQLMLSPVGKGLRALLAFGGIFPQAEHAWQALADTFGTDVDDTIRSLLSGRVAVFWDGIAPTNNTNTLANAIDTHWTLLCEVDPAFVKDIRKSLRPAKRDIVHSRAVYAIEQGRYHIALIEPFKEGQAATILLAPRSGTTLLHAVLAHLGNPNPADQSALAPVVTPHEPMLAELSTLHQNTNDAQDWSVAFITRINMLSALVGWPEQTPQTNSSTIAGIINLDQSTLACTFVTNSSVDPTTPDAPIELFDTLHPDAIFTMASARSPKMIITNNSLSLTMSATENPKPSDTIFDAPTVITISDTKSRSMCITACFEHDNAPDTAHTADDAIRQLIQSFDPNQAPNFHGRFPTTPRQIALRIPQSEDANTNWDWPGPHPNLAWLSTQTRSNDLVIASIGPESSDPTTHAQSFAKAAHALDALDAPRRSGVLFRLNMIPDRTMRLFADANGADLMLAKLVEEIDIDVRRGIDAPVRGRFILTLTEFASKPKIGYQSDDEE
jgi:hypothetical protein